MFDFYAPRDDFDYVSMGGFCCSVKADEADANYDNGILKVVVPFEERMDKAIKSDTLTTIYLIRTGRRLVL